MHLPRFSLAFFVAFPLAAAIQPIAVEGGLIAGAPGWG
jgi:hypothetical protein